MYSNRERYKPLVLITGSAGLIGTRLVAELVAHYRVIGLDMKQPPRIPAGSDWLECDLTSDSSVRCTLDLITRRHGQYLASVIHLAGYCDFFGTPSPHYRALTVEGTRRLLGGLREFTVEQFVFASTLLVMKPAEPGMVITEESPLQAEWDFPLSKMEAETIVHEQHGRIPVVILRLAATYDEHGNSPPLAYQMSRIYERKLDSHLYPGHKDRGQPFIHLDDAVSAFRKVVEKRGVLDHEQVFLIAEPAVVTYGHLQERLGELIHGKEWTTLRIPAAAARAGAWFMDKLSPSEPFVKPWMVDLVDAHYPVSIDKARALLGWFPRHRLDDTLADMVHHLKQDPDRFYEQNGIAA